MIEKTKAAVVRKALRKEFVDFFVTMTTVKPENNWPAIPDSEMVDGIADALLEMGKRRGTGVAMLQTLVHELQDRVNQTVTQSRNR